MYEVWKINERGNYQLVKRTKDVKKAVITLKILRANGIWAQMCKEGEKSITGGKR